MDGFFGTPWADVTLDTVEGFFSSAGDEGLTWEAKGTQQPHPHSVRKHVGAFGNAVGGFYIVGAVQSDGVWTVEGVEFGDEPQAWLSRVIRSNLRPVPVFDVRAWSKGDGHVAVVNVDPVAEPPCMTIDGEVFMRVSGESYPLTDAVALQRLLERGTSRSAEAEAVALQAAAVTQPKPEVPCLSLRLALAPTGRLDDIGSRLFTQGFYEELMGAIQRLPADPLFPYGRYQAFGRMTTQDSIIVQEATDENLQRWMLQARWDGSVAAYLDVEPKPQENPSLVDTAIFGSAVRPAAYALVDLVRRLGGYGRGHLVLVVDAHEFQVVSINGNQGQIPGRETMLPIRAWIDLDGDWEGDNEELDFVLDRMRRELCRSAGAIVWES